MAYETLMLPIKDASIKTGLTYGCIRQLCLTGKIKYIRAGGTKFYVNMDSLIAYCGGNNSTSEKFEKEFSEVVINK